MIETPKLEGVFETPCLVFTLQGNTRSIAVLAELHIQNGNGGVQHMVFESSQEVKAFFAKSGISPDSALTLLDQKLGRKHFRPTCRSRRTEVHLPEWTNGAQWAVMVGENCTHPERCARQLRADFSKNFTARLQRGQFPWGPGKKMGQRGQQEQPPTPVMMPENIQAVIAGLNAGPDLVAAVADKNFAAEIPAGSKISWIRVVSQPLLCDGALISKILEAFRKFEQVSNMLVAEDPEVQRILLSGVDLQEGSRLADCYLHPTNDHFSISRPDLHHTGREMPFASEIDEMPGGMPELVHIDATYGINQARWERAFSWLCERGTLVFLVSSEWSRCYIPETSWLINHLQGQGFPITMVTTDQADRFKVTDHGVLLDGEPVGTIWRQFPIFETRGMLAEIVLAAQDGRVRLLPEFAHFGNKSWFSVFRSHQQFYRNNIEAETMGILEKVLPHSYMVGGRAGDPFPFNINGYEVDSVAGLALAPEPIRDAIVLKICGANNLAARSYGVLMGNGIDQDQWFDWITERTNKGQPFVVQHRLEAGTVRIPVMNIKTGLAELFSCRILGRPWEFNGELISMHGCAVPSYLYRVHGMVDMAVVPFSF